MKLKTTLCAVLLSLTSVSMVACSSGDSSNGTKTSVAALDNSLDSQLKTVETEIAELEAQKESITNDILTASEFSNAGSVTEARENLDKLVNEMIAVNQKLNNVMKTQQVEPTHPLVQESIEARKAVDAAKLAYDELQEVSVESNKEIQIIDFKIASKKVDKQIIDTKTVSYTHLTLPTIYSV